HRFLLHARPLSFGSARGLQIGETIRDVAVFLNAPDGADWYLTTTVYDSESGESTILHEWDVAGFVLTADQIRDLVTSWLRTLAEISSGAEKNALLAALLAWGALVDRPDDSVWATEAMAATLGHQGGEFPVNGAAVTKLHVEGTTATEDEKARLLRWFDPDYA
nr:hypothetical protein [Actinomycetota bacterium]